MLDELLLGGEIQETSKKNVLKAIAAQDLLQEVVKQISAFQYYIWVANESLSWTLIAKDAGFVHESLRIETNRIYWDFWSYESKRIESFEIFGLTKRIHDTNP